MCDDGASLAKSTDQPQPAAVSSMMTDWPTVVPSAVPARSAWLKVTAEKSADGRTACQSLSACAIAPDSSAAVSAVVVDAAGSDAASRFAPDGHTTVPAEPVVQSADDAAA